MGPPPLDLPVGPHERGPRPRAANQRSRRHGPRSGSTRGSPAYSQAGQAWTRVGFPDEAEPMAEVLLRTTESSPVCCWEVPAQRPAAAERPLPPVAAGTRRRAVLPAHLPHCWQAIERGPRHGAAADASTRFQQSYPFILNLPSLSEFQTPPANSNSTETVSEGCQIDRWRGKGAEKVHLARVGKPP